MPKSSVAQKVSDSNVVEKLGQLSMMNLNILLIITYDLLDASGKLKEDDRCHMAELIAEGQSEWGDKFTASLDLFRKDVETRRASKQQSGGAA